MSCEMTHRQRFYNAVMHRPADRAVFDLCGSPQTDIDYQETRDALKAFLGLAGAKQGNFTLDERILERFHVDTRRVGGMPTPRTVHNRQEGGVVYDSYGIGRRLLNGHYEICHNPLMDCTIDEMLSYPMPEADDVNCNLIEDWARQAQWLHENTDYAVVAEHPFFGVFEIGCWMFGFDDYLYRLAGEPETVHAFSARVMAYQAKVIEKYYGALGRYIDCTTSGDDFGMQTGPFMSLGMFREYIAPYYQKRIALTRSHTDAFFKHHSCGSVHAFIPTLIACGVDILNPMQPGTYMMEPERLKKDFGDKITFWGGIDTQQLLPRGSADEVKADVRRLLDIMAPGGGYILAPAHCIQSDVPVENIAAMYDGAAAYYGE